ncbi:MAG: FmdB family zinc ribbon protein [Limisphaerales bacterium]
MPTYQYVCEKCGHDFEFTQSMKDDALKTCPKEKCGQKRWGRGRVARQLSGGAGLIFKGSGFYITDYRSDAYKSAAKKDAESSAPKKETKDSPPSAASTPATPKPADKAKPSAT